MGPVVSYSTFVSSGTPAGALIRSSPDYNVGAQSWFGPFRSRLVCSERNRRAEWRGHGRRVVTAGTRRESVTPSGFEGRSASACLRRDPSRSMRHIASLPGGSVGSRPENGGIDDQRG